MADPNGPANMLATAVFWTVIIPGTALAPKALGALTKRHVRGHVRRALDNGDQQILRAVIEQEDAYARRPQPHASVPKQLTADRSHR